MRLNRKHFWFHRKSQALWNAITQARADRTRFDNRRSDLGRRPALIVLGLATAVGAAFRFYGLGWGAPFFHFHIDEHFVFMGVPTCFGAIRMKQRCRASSSCTRRSRCTC